MPKFYAELWRAGPINKEAFRLAAETLRKEYGAQKWDAMSEVQRKKHCIALLWNSEDVMLKRAKWNLENKS